MVAKRLFFCLRRIKSSVVEIDNSERGIHGRPRSFDECLLSAISSDSGNGLASPMTK
jgi:hypothetical protein